MGSYYHKKKDKLKENEINVENGDNKRDVAIIDLALNLRRRLFNDIYIYIYI
jgi:hypothetical protein